jgi:FKBP-type peptidyl-prolyl cis-trans isomerase
MNTLSFTSTKCIAILGMLLLAAPGRAQQMTALKTDKDKRSYAVGVDLAKNLKRQGVEVEPDALLQGMRDMLSGGKLLMTEEALTDTLRAYQTDLRKKKFQARGGMSVLAEENREKGAAFLATNKTSQGVVTLPSGVQYKILKAGNGKKPAATDTIECRHRGLSIDGEEFNNSDRGGKPVILKMSDVIPGWKEVLPLMPVGSKWQIAVPSELAYGEQGVVDARGRVKIGPNATLIFELELLSIK